MDRALTPAPTADDRLAADRRARHTLFEPPGEYNFRHFRTKHLVRDARRTIGDRGIIPGEMAPDFTLPIAHGLGAASDPAGDLRLSELRGRPVLLHFGSFT
jgi:hypothetical protein